MYLSLVAALWLLALSGVLLVTLHPLLKLGLTLFLLLYGVALYRGEVRLLGRAAVLLALWDEQDQWRIQVGRGSLQGAELLPDSLNLPFLVILRFKTLAGSRYSLPLFRDSLDADSHRRLRTRLKVYAARLKGSDEQR